MGVNPLILTTSMALVGILAALWLIISVRRYPKGNEKMVAVWAAIRQGSNAYLRRQFKTIAYISVLLAVAIFATFGHSYGITLGTEIALSFLLGVTFSLTAAYIAMYSATNANVRSTAAAEKSTYEALKVATLGGAALGLAVISMSLLGLSILYAAFGDPGVLAGFGFGASLAALFAQLGGGIFTKSADVGADLVGKVEEDFPEDDPRNPAAIADNVGDNVGDEAGRGADLFESLTAENLGGMIIGLIVSIILFGKLTNYSQISIYYVTMPLLVRALGIVATLIGLIVAVYEKKFKNPIKPTRDGLLVATVVAGVLMFIATWVVFGPGGVTPDGSANASLSLYGCMVSGLAAGLLIVVYTEYYTGSAAKPVIRIAERSRSGPALTVMSGMSTGLISAGLPLVTVAAALLISFGLGEQFASIANLGNTFLGGVYGTTMSAMGMLSTAGIVLTMDGLGPIVDNAGGIAEMSGASPEVRERIDPLDALGNTTKALTKGYAMGSAVLASLLLFQAFLLEVARYKANIISLATIGPAQATALANSLNSLGTDLALNHPQIVIGLLIGGMLPFVFSGTAIEAVANGSYKMVEEVRRQFKETPGLREGKALPDYSRAVDISTRTALRLMVTPGLIVVLTPIIMGVVLGWAAVGALVIGATVSAVPLAIMMMWGGAAMDNSKKYVEAGNLGGKGTETHAATVVGDTVGDPWKDTAGPSLHILIKLLNTISLVFIPLFLAALLVL